MADFYRFGVYLLSAVVANSMVALEQRQVGVYALAGIATLDRRLGELS